jgi:hypothetical protein
MSPSLSDRWYRRSGSGLGAAFPAALFEAGAVAVHLQDVDVMGKAVEQGAGQPFRAEDLYSLLERQIRCHHR